MNLLLDQFLSEEASPSVRCLISDAIEEYSKESKETSKKFELNRFEVTLFFPENYALIEDVLDSAVSGEIRLPLVTLLAFLKDDSPSIATD